jgi:hypothetical protein
VPRYFFNFESGPAAGADLIGRDLADDAAATAEAAKLAAELGMDDAIEGERPAFQWIEVLDEEHRPVARLPVAEALKGPNRTT